MLAAARGIQDWTGGLSLDQYLKQRVVQLAVECELDILGESVLAHDYDDIEPILVWKVVTTHLPMLIAQLALQIPPLLTAID